MSDRPPTEDEAVIFRRLPAIERLAAFGRKRDAMRGWNRAAAMALLEDTIDEVVAEFNAMKAAATSREQAETRQRDDRLGWWTDLPGYWGGHK